MSVLRSLVLSILASTLATIVARRVLQSPQTGETDQARPRRAGDVVILVPVLVGNSGNRIGWVKEVHHHHRALVGFRGR
ncbi:MAG TPA: hypothetical protein VKX16_17950 [Chloroflexota bacterium]|nr:hypothetical protein [Chloroflexota bacterium]